MPRTKAAAPPAPTVEPVVTAPPPAQLPAVMTGSPPRQQLYYASKALKSLHAIMKGVAPVAKEGENKFHRYHYARSEDVVGPVRDLMVQHDLLLFQSEVAKKIEGDLLLIEYEFVWAHVDGDALPPVFMSGSCKLTDQKGVMDDKAVPKCHTQAEKYFLIKSLRIKVGDLPDSDAGPPVPGPNIVGTGAAAGQRTSGYGNNYSRPTSPADDRSQRPDAAGRTEGAGAGAQRTADRLDIQAIAALEKEARQAADRGSEVLAVFWKSLRTKQQQQVVSGLMTELVERRNRADKEIEQFNEQHEATQAAAEYVDPETGEAIQG